MLVHSLWHVIVHLCVMFTSCGSYCNDQFPTFHVNKFSSEKQTWTSHISQSPSFQVIKRTFDEYGATLSMPGIFNPHTTDSTVITCLELSHDEKSSSSLPSPHMSEHVSGILSAATQDTNVQRKAAWMLLCSSMCFTVQSFRPVKLS